MRIREIVLHRVRVPMVAPVEAAHGTEVDRRLVLVEVHGTGGEHGWGECAALAAPTYTAEHVDGAALVLGDHLVPRLLEVEDLTAAAVGGHLASIVGHPMAKAALELAVHDAELRAAGRSLADDLGATRTAVDAGVTIGIGADLDALVEDVAGQVAAGYRRVKLKVRPHWDLEPVAAVREAFPDLPLQVDANGAYELRDWARLAALDAYDLLLIEQPLAADDLDGHAELARRIATPLCLDEPLDSLAATEAALDAGACSVVNLKPGRVGGLLEAVRIHDLCRERGVGLWCGGMYESGLGRAANLALAALPGFTLTGDLSASDRWFPRDLIDPPHRLVDGQLTVPTGPGIGAEPDPAALASFTEDRRSVTA